jgi:putative hydrolase of the HAD superfamily
LAGVAPKAIALLPPEQAARLTPATLALAVRHAYVELEEAACGGDLEPMPGELCVVRGLATLGLKVDTQTAREMVAALYVSERHTTHLLTGVVETLLALAQAELRLGIISNRMFGGTLLLDDLAFFGISHLFSAIVVSCEIEQMKPHPALFQRALEELGVAPDEAVMVGDDLCADIGGALAAGLHAVWVRRPPDRPEAPPPGVPVITRLAELPPLLLPT